MPTPKQLRVAEFRAKISAALEQVTLAREKLIVATKHGRVLLSPLDPPVTKVSAMPVLFESAAQRRWGFYTDEDPRMHLQTFDDKPTEMRVWLERKGTRVFEWDDVAPHTVPNARTSKAVLARVLDDYQRIEARWVKLMIRTDEMAAHIEGNDVLVTMYPGRPHAFTRRISLAKHFASTSSQDRYDWVADFDKRAGLLRVGSQNDDPDDRDNINIAPYMFVGSYL